MRKAFAKDLSIKIIVEKIKETIKEGKVRHIIAPLAKSEVLELSYMGYLISLEGGEARLGGLTKEDLEIFRGDYDSKFCKIQW